LEQGKRILWDTGRLLSEQSVNVSYGGPVLVSQQRYYWRVRVWDKLGRASAWSEPAFWEMGLLHPSDWKANWITPDWMTEKWDEYPTKSPMLRKAFQLDKKIVLARLYATSLGLYEMQINGKVVGDQVLAPGWTEYDARLNYETYDVTKMLRTGENAMGAMIGDGWFRGHLGWTSATSHDIYGSRLALLAQLQITYADGSTEVVGTDNTWKASTGPIISSEIYDGETYDARLEKTGWSQPGYDDHTWSSTLLLDHSKAILVAPKGPAMRRMMEIKPLGILHTPSGETVFDMGQNIAGWVRLKVKGPAGATVTLRHGEVLDKDGNLYLENLRRAKQTVTYTLKGGDEETYEPHFTYQGFRYVGVKGYPGELTLDSITGVVLYADMEQTGEWESSDGRLNRLQQNIIWSQRGNFLAIPSDCPQRDERLGWTADVQMFAPAASFNYNVDGFLAGWLRDLAADQKPDGDLPNTIPDWRHIRLESFSESRSGWGDSSVIVPWTLYLSFGDKRVLEDQYPSMKKWVEWLRSRNPDLIVHNPMNQHGDWLAYASPSATVNEYPGATTGLDLAATAYFAHSADLLAQVAAVLGKQEDVKTYRTLFEQIKATWDHEFVTPAGRVGENTQTAYTLALAFNLLPAEMRKEAAGRLADNRIPGDYETKAYHLTTGLMGTPLITFALSDGGEVDTAYKLLEQDTYPSWLWPITMGATTMWERWDAQKADGTMQDLNMNSFNHYARGAIGDWMYRVVAGIDLDPADPGYHHVLIRPQPGGQLLFVRAKLETGYGEIASSWEVTGDSLRVTVKVPPNTHATVRLPSALLSDVKEGSQSITGNRSISNPHQDGQEVAFDVGSGTYVFSYPSQTLTAKLSKGTPYTVDDTVDDLLALPKTRAVLEKVVPAFVSGSTGRFKGLTLRIVAEATPQMFPPATLALIDKELGIIAR